MLFNWSLQVRYFCKGVKEEACGAEEERSLDMEETVKVEQGMDAMFRRFIQSDSGASQARRTQDTGKDRQAILDRMTQGFREYASRHLDAELGPEETKKSESKPESEEDDQPQPGEAKRSSLINLLSLLKKALNEN